MSELLDSMYNDNLILLCVIMGVIALALSIAIFVEMYKSNRKLVPKEEKEEPKDLELTENKLNIKESADIKYVDEDKDLEKTKAKMELAKLREKLKKEEEEKQKLIELNMALAKNANKDESIEKEKELEKTIEVKIDKQQLEQLQKNAEVKKDIKEEVKEEKAKSIDKDALLDQVRVKILPQEEKLDSKNVEDNITTIEKDAIPELKIQVNENEILKNEPDDEDTAIISYDELKNAQSFGYTDEEMDKYLDEKDAIISIQELEKLYLESQNIEVPTDDEKKIVFEMKRVEDLPEIADKNNFQTSPFISPVYGMSKNDRDLVLEKTANLEKLNEEIRKTNEFLKALKDLKKNLQ